MTERLIPDERRCRGTHKKRGDRCKRPAIPGGTVCTMHGGGAPQVRAAAERRVAAEAITREASAILAYNGVTPIDDPLGELGKLAAAAKAMTEALGARVNALTDLEVMSVQNTPQLRVVVELYERALDRTHRMLDSLVKHGYAERQITIAETEALLVAGVIRRVVAGLGLSADQQQLAQTLLAQEFRALEQQAVPRG